MNDNYEMHISEVFIKGKISDDKCEDAIYLGKRFIAVIDGVTSKGKRLYQDKTSGRFAAEVLKRELSHLDYEWQDRDFQANELLRNLNESLRLEMKTVDDETIGVEDYLRAAIIILDKKEKRIINYGDCQCRIGDKVFSHSKAIDAKLAEKRADMLIRAIHEGVSQEELMKNDIGRKAILTDLRKQFEYENKNCKYGYPVLNGCGINEEMIVEHPIREGESVILCSDGYPYVCDSLEASERKLHELLQNDRLLIWNYKSTKGVQYGADSFDDRAWVKVEQVLKF